MEATAKRRCPRCLLSWHVGDRVIPRGIVTDGGYGLTHADCPRKPQRQPGDMFPLAIKPDQLNPADATAYTALGLFVGTSAPSEPDKPSTAHTDPPECPHGERVRLGNRWFCREDIRGCTPISG